MPLSHVDYEQLLSAVSRLNSDINPKTLPARTLDCVMLLIPNEVTVFDGFDDENYYNGYLWYSPAGLVSDEQVRVLGELIHEHPVYQDIVVGRIQKTVRTSQYLPLAEFHRTAIYNEFYRHIGADVQMTATLDIAPGLFITCSLHRLKTDFTDRDLAVLNLLAPHLVSAFRTAQFINRLEAEQQHQTKTPEATKYGVVTLDAGLNIRSQDDTAVRLLCKYFRATSDRLPEVLRRYVAHYHPTFYAEEFFLPPPPLEVKRHGSKLKVRLALEARERALVLLMEESGEVTAAALERLGVTHREAEILFWLAKGKTNMEIGILCGISWRTVQKHTEHIYEKLGVETRTAAAMRAIEVIKRIC